MYISFFDKLEDYIIAVDNFDFNKIPILSQKRESSIHMSMLEYDRNNIDYINNDECRSCTFVLKGSMSEPIAKLHSILTSQKLYIVECVYDIEKMINGYLQITIIGLPEEIKLEDIFYLQSLRKRLEKSFVFSILINRDIYALSELIVRNELSKYVEERDSIFIDRMDFEGSSNEQGYKYLNSINSDVQTVLGNMNTSEFDIFSIIGHGRDEFVWLKDGVICGKNQIISNNIEMEKYGKPCCHYTGHCYKHDLKVLPGNKINALHFFINSCYSALIDDSSFGLNYNILYSILTGKAVSYFGSTSAVDGIKALNLYYIALFKSGYSLGMTAAMVNDVYNSYKLGNENGYFLIGDCTYKLKNVVKPTIYELPLNRLSSDFEIEVAPNSRIIVLKFEGRNILPEYLDFKLRIDVIPSSKEELHMVIHSTKEGSEIHIFSEGPIKSDIFKINFSLNKKLDLSSIQSLYRLAGTGVPVNREFESLLKETSDFANKLSKNIKYDRIALNKVRKLYKKVDNFHNRIKKLNIIFLLGIQKSINENSFSYEETILENGFYFLRQTPGVENCFNCQRSTYIDEYTNMIYKNVYLSYTCCPNCGVIKVHENDNTCIVPVIKGPNLLKDNFLENKLEIYNNSNEEKEVYYSFSLTRSVENNISINKEVECIIIPPYMKVEVPIYIEKNNTIPHVYWLKINLMVNSNLISLKKDIYIGL